MNNQASTYIAFVAYYQIFDDKINLSETHLYLTKEGRIVMAAILNLETGHMDGFASRMKKRYSNIRMPRSPAIQRQPG